ncbi:MAG: SIMPL domain-containing protein [Armatimonadota bacterium]
MDLVKPESYDWRVCYQTDESRMYGARQMIRVTLKDVSILEDLLTKSLEAGVIRIVGVNFRTSNLRKYRDQARTMAIKAAKEKAALMAGELGCKIGQPQSISEQPSYGRDWYYYGSSWWGGGGGYSSSANSVQNISDEPSSSYDNTALSLGQIAVTARVTVSFELSQ